MSRRRASTSLMVMLAFVASCAEAVNPPLSNELLPPRPPPARLIPGSFGVVVVGDQAVREQVQQEMERWLRQRGYRNTQFNRNALAVDVLAKVSECMAHDNLTCMHESSVHITSARLLVARVIADPDPSTLDVALAWVGGGAAAMAPVCKACSDPTWRVRLARELGHMAEFIETAVDIQEQHRGTDGIGIQPASPPEKD